jgi:hypothetical protein
VRVGVDIQKTINAKILLYALCRASSHNAIF